MLLLLLLKEKGVPATTTSVEKGENLATIHTTKRMFEGGTLLPLLGDDGEIYFYHCWDRMEGIDPDATGQKGRGTLLLLLMGCIAMTCMAGKT